MTISYQNKGLGMQAQTPGKHPHSCLHTELDFVRGKGTVRGNVNFPS